MVVNHVVIIAWNFNCLLFNIVLDILYLMAYIDLIEIKYSLNSNFSRIIFFFSRWTKRRSTGRSIILTVHPGRARQSLCSLQAHTSQPDSVNHTAKSCCSPIDLETRSKLNVSVVKSTVTSADTQEYRWCWRPNPQRARLVWLPSGEGWLLLFDLWLILRRTTRKGSLPKPLL